MLVDAVHADYRSAPIDERLRCALGALELLAKRPWEVCPQTLEPMRAAGLDDEAIEDVGAVGSLFAMFTRVADAFDFAAPTPFETKVMRLLLKGGYESRDVLGAEFPRHRQGVEATVQASLSASGPTDKDVRIRLARWVEANVRGQQPEDLQPQALAAFATKQVRGAYKIVDEDFEALTEAGFEDEAIYDIVVVVAVAAGATRYRLFLDALSPPAR